MAKVVGEFDRIAEFVAKFEINRNIGVEMLIDAYELKARRPLVDRRTQNAAAHRPAPALRKQRGCEHEQQSCGDDDKKTRRDGRIRPSRGAKLRAPIRVGETAFTAHCPVLFRLTWEPAPC